MLSLRLQLRPGAVEICQHRVTYRNIRVLRDYTSSSLALSVLWVLPALHSWQCPNCAYHESKLLGAFQSSRLMTRPSGATKNFSNHVVRGGGQTHRKCLISWRPTLIETKILKRVGGPSCPRPSCLLPPACGSPGFVRFVATFCQVSVALS